MAGDLEFVSDLQGRRGEIHGRAGLAAPDLRHCQGVHNARRSMACMIKRATREVRAFWLQHGLATERSSRIYASSREGRTRACARAQDVILEGVVSLWAAGADEAACKLAGKRGLALGRFRRDSRCVRLRRSGTRARTWHNSSGGRH